MRPALHFTARSGWINDPHGIAVRDGEYHAFFQYVPGSTVWGLNCHWGHAKGPDLLSLTELPVAIEPGDGDEGVWTGALVTDGDEARIFYTTVAMPDVHVGRVRVATAEDDDWNSWTKGSVVAQPPAELDITAYRDPFVQREADGWRMFVGATRGDDTAVVLSYTSTDLDVWTYDGIVTQRSAREREPVWTGTLWECPQLFTSDERAAFVFSVWEPSTAHDTAFAVGAYADGRFEPARYGRLAYGDSLYAPSLFFDADGEPCLTFWMRGIVDADAGWAGVHSVPYRVRIVDDAVVAEPHPDVARHRVEEAADGRVAGLAADIEWVADAGELTISSGDAAVVRVRRGAASVDIEIGDAVTTVPASGPLRILVDGPVLEVASEGGLFGAAVAPAGHDLLISATEGALRVHRLGR